MSRNRQVVEETVDGVTVTKEFDEDRFALPAIRYELSSTRTEPVRVRLVEDPPPSLEPEQFGFHSEYGSHDWRIDDGCLVFERRLDPGEDVTTIVGVREVEDTRQLLDDVDDVVVTSADAPADPESTSDESVEEALDEALNDDAGHPAGPTREPTRFEDRGEEHEAEDDSGGTATAGIELSTDEPADGQTDSIDARIRHLQADVADLRAYTAALEEFLDEHGSATEVVADFDDRLDTFQDDLAALETRVEANDDAISSVSADVDEVRESVDDNDAELDEVLTRLEAVETQLEDVGDLSTLADRLTSVEADVDEVNRWRESLRSALSAPDRENEPRD